MSDFDIHTLAAAFALDALEPEEAELFEAHLPNCDLCTSEVTDFRETAAALANAESVEPPASLRESVLSGISTTRQLPPVVSPLPDANPHAEDAESGRPLSAPIDLTEHRNRRKIAQAALGAIAAALIVVVGVVNFTGNDSDLPSEVAAVVDAEDAAEIPLVGTSSNLGDLKIIYSADNAGVALIGDGLEALDPDQTYELWAIDADGARPIGLFDADVTGEVADFLETSEATDVTWGVTVEPAGGSLQPTTEPIFLSS